ncbi:polysaccharide biosynthesis tyrosine autokinase [uncultured Williamsia sp.]|uniref:polysaccharide biosynthesis tyrosine autokinase n=1 Tax=uncultured Williamsia sp. TaxID=259311 RepID=UPI00260C395D|nr:polysaccharide biosynthesis tyrosine autokinase [uncultured Williamsia sp.]
MTGPAEVRTADDDAVRSVVRALRSGWIVIVLIAVIFGGVALGVSAAQPAKYRATAIMYVTSGGGDAGQNAYQGPQASQQRVQSYTRLVTTDAVVGQALQTSGVPLSLDEARKAVSATASVDTVLLNIAVVEHSRSIAERLAGGIATAMTTSVARLETPSGGGQPLAKLTLVTPATSESTPVSPKPVRNVALAVLAGLVVGAVGVVIRAQTSNKVRSSADLARVTDTPVLGVIPRDDLLRRRGVIDFGEGAAPAAEAFRKLRTNLSFARVDDPPRVILVTSPSEGEGKTTVVMNLAAAIVESGRRVVIVDADLRRPQVDQRSGSVGSVGLTNWLRGDGDPHDLVQPSQVEDLWILSAGTRAPNPAELLGSTRMREVVDDLSKTFDVVIIDSPPVLPVTDAVVLSAWVDGTVIVARSGATRFVDLRDTSTQLSAAGGRLFGAVLIGTASGPSAYTYGPQKAQRSRFRRRDRGRNVTEVLR